MPNIPGYYDTTPDQDRRAEEARDKARQELEDNIAHVIIGGDGKVSSNGLIAYLADLEERLKRRYMDDLEELELKSEYDGNWMYPNWERTTKVHDWRNYISKELREIWHTFTDEQKKLIAASAEDSASHEEWD